MVKSLVVSYCVISMTIPKTLHFSKTNFDDNNHIIAIKNPTIFKFLLRLLCQFFVWQIIFLKNASIKISSIS